MNLLRACDCMTVYCRHNPRKITGPSFWVWFALLFVKRRVVWDHSEGLVSVFKSWRGVTYVLAQEPIVHGDPRNAQIDRWS